MRMTASHNYFDLCQVTQKFWTDLAVSVISTETIVLILAINFSVIFILFGMDDNFFYNY